MLKCKSGIIIAAGATALFTALGSAQAADAVRAVTPFPAKFVFAKNFQSYIERVNKIAPGALKVDFIGGPEVTPGRKQQQAVARGLFDMVWGPSTYYLGTVPQVYAMLGSNISPMEARANGGTEMLDKIWRKKLNSHFLGWMLGGIGFNLYLKKQPKIGANNLPDLTGLKLRIAPTYRAFFTSLGAATVRTSIGEVYTALERGVVDGLGWPEIGINDFGWNRFVKVQVSPSFLQTPLVVIINQEKWAKLSDKSRDILTKATIDHEKASYDFIRNEAKLQNKVARERGIALLTLPGDGAAKYRRGAAEVVWDQLKKRVPEEYDALRAKFYRDDRS